MDVGSGALLGGMDRWQSTPFIVGRSLTVQPRSSDSNLPIFAACRLPLQDQTSDYLDPIRATAPLYPAAGVEPFTTARPTASPFACSHRDASNCLIGAVRPNVKDEPRPQRARLVPRFGSRFAASFRKDVR